MSRRKPKDVSTGKHPIVAEIPRRSRRWFAKLEMKDSIAYAINGFSLLFAWLGVRLVFGISQSARFWGDTLANRSEIPTGIMLWYTVSRTRTCAH